MTPRLLQRRASRDHASPLSTLLRSRRQLTHTPSRYSLLDDDREEEATADDASMGSGAPAADHGAASHARWHALAKAFGLNPHRTNSAAAADVGATSQNFDAEQIDVWFAEQTAMQAQVTKRAVSKAQREWTLSTQASAAAHERERNEWQEELTALRVKSSTALHELTIMAEGKLEEAGADVEEAEMKTRIAEAQLSARVAAEAGARRAARIELDIATRDAARLRVRFTFAAWKLVTCTKRKLLAAVILKWRIRSAQRLWSLWGRVARRRAMIKQRVVLRWVKTKRRFLLRWRERAQRAKRARAVSKRVALQLGALSSRDCMKRYFLRWQQTCAETHVQRTFITRWLRRCERTIIARRGDGLRRGFRALHAHGQSARVRARDATKRAMRMWHARSQRNKEFAFRRLLMHTIACRVVLVPRAQPTKDQLPIAQPLIPSARDYRSKIERSLRLNAGAAEAERDSRYRSELRPFGTFDAPSGDSKALRDSYERTVTTLHSLGCGATLRNLEWAYQNHTLGVCAANVIRKPER